MPPSKVLAIAVLICCSLGFRAHATDLDTPDLSFSNPQPVTIQDYEGDIMEPFVSRDGHYLFFNNANDPSEKTKLYYAQQIAPTRFQFMGPVQGANAENVLNAVASMDEQNEFYFITTRSYGEDQKTIYHGHFVKGRITDVQPVENITRRKLGWLNMDAEIAASGDTLYFTDNQFDGGKTPRASAIKMAHPIKGRFVIDENSDEFLHLINNEGLNYAPCSSRNGLDLYFTRITPSKDDAPHIYVAHRSSTHEPFGVPAQILAASGFVEAPTLSANEQRLYYHRKDNDGRYSLYVLNR